MTGSAASDALAVEAHDEAQRAVRRRVLRPEVEDHVAGVELDVHLRVGEVAQRAGLDLEARACIGVSVVLMSPPRSPLRRSSALGGVVVVARHRLDVDEPGPRLHHAREQREVLAQRVPLELRRQVEVAQARVPVEDEAVHLPALALVPVGAGVHRRPTTRRAASASSTSVLSVSAPVRARRLHVREHLEAARRPGGAERHLGGLHRRRRVAAGLVALAFGAGCQSMPEMNER